MPRRQKRRTGKRDIAPLPQAQLTGVVQTPSRETEAPSASPETETEERAVRSPRSARPSVEVASESAFVGPELRRIVGLMTLVIILLVVLSIVLR